MTLCYILEIISLSIQDTFAEYCILLSILNLKAIQKRMTAEECEDCEG